MFDMTSARSSGTTTFVEVNVIDSVSWEDISLLRVVRVLNIIALFCPSGDDPANDTDIAP